MKKIIAIVLISVLCLGAFAACGNSKVDDWADVESAGKIVIGITDYKPMNYYDTDGTLIGFDTEYAEAVCEKLGISAEFIIVDWDNKEIELNAHNIDCIWNGMTYTKERDENMDFSEPYIYNALVAVVRSADVDTYKTTADMVSAKVTAEGGSTAEDAIMEDEDLSKANFIPAASLIDSLMEVSASASDVAIVDSTMAYELVGTGAYANLVIVEDLILSEEVLAIGFRTGSDLPAMIDKITQELIADGTLPALAEKYGLTLMLG